MLAKSQVGSINQYAHGRFVLMDAFRRNLTGNIPAGSRGLNRNAVKAYSEQLYRLDGQISYARAQVMGPILGNLTANQCSYLNTLVGQGMDPRHMFIPFTPYRHPPRLQCHLPR